MNIQEFSGIFRNIQDHSGISLHKYLFSKYYIRIFKILHKNIQNNTLEYFKEYFMKIFHLFHSTYILYS